MKKEKKKPYLVVPGLLVVVNHGSAEASGWVDSGTGNRDSGQVYHEDCKPYG